MSNAPRQDWEVQLATVSDVSFIIDSWCNAEHVYTSRAVGEDPEIFKVGQRARVLRLLSACRCAVVRPTAEWFASQGKPVDPKLIFGWVCYGLERTTLKPIVHFVYVKSEHRKQGMADALLVAAGVKPEVGAWATSTRYWLRNPLDARGIMYNRFLLDYDPANTRR